jgi:hypothetical protein
MSIPGIDWDELAPKSGKLTEAELNARAAVEWENDHAAAFFAVKIFEACESGPCDGGKKLCHTPQACQRAVQDFCGYTWADRFADWFWALPIIERAGPGTGLALIVGSGVALFALGVAVWP